MGGLTAAVFVYDRLAGLQSRGEYAVIGVVVSRPDLTTTDFANSAAGARA